MSTFFFFMTARLGRVDIHGREKKGKEDDTAKALGRVMFVGSSLLFCFVLALMYGKGYHCMLVCSGGCFSLSACLRDTTACYLFLFAECEFIMLFCAHVCFSP